jgi:2-isopropylmalate synthase
MKYKLQMEPEAVLQAVVDSVSYARNLCDDVEWSCEDGSRTEQDFLCRCVEAAIRAGARTVNIPDTVGYAVPDEYAALIGMLFERVPNIDRAIVSVHCHNDLGLAVANTLAALAAGARRVECTINGIGERAGNTSLEEVVMLLKVRQARLGLECGIDTTEITRTSRLVSELTGTPVQPNKAVVGANAFAHASGIHQDGVLKDRLNYEIMKPEDVGLADSRIVLTARSGRHAFHHRLNRLGIKLVDGSGDAAWQRFLQLADTKKEVTDEDLRKIAAMSDTNGHESNGHPPVTDQLHDHNHVADAMRHLIFG